MFNISYGQNHMEVDASQSETLNYLSKLPEGYLNDNESEIEADFDKDGLNDLAVVLSDSEGNPHLFIYLSSNFKKDKSYQACEWMLMVHMFSFEKDVLNLISSMGGASALSLNCGVDIKYDSTTRKMKIMKFEGDSTPPKLVDFKLN